MTTLSVSSRQLLQDSLNPHELQESKRHCFHMYNVVSLVYYSIIVTEINEWHSSPNRYKDKYSYKMDVR